MPDKTQEVPALESFDLVTQHLVMSEHLNPNHHIFGGQLLAWLDVDIYLYTSDRMKYKSMVTVSMNNVYFRNPAVLGDIVRIYGQISEIRRSSVTAYGKAVAYDPEGGAIREIIECEITYVAVDKNGKPTRAFKDKVNTN